jgi:spermidine/putrescine transport system substrate-binding protein
VTLPFKDSNPPIDDGLDPETGGAFKILNYDQYMAPGVMKDFGDEHGVEVQVTPYSNYDEMLAKIRTPGESFDLVFPGPSVLSKMVYTELIQPINHSYVPNLKNVWPEFQDPWYDREARYTVPYTIYGTGVLYRADMVTSIPDNGYDLMWDEAYAGKIYLLDDLQEAIGMSLLRNKISTDINTSNAADVQEATDSLIDLIGRVNVKTDVSAYSEVPEGTATIHQCWSGDPIAGQYYLPKGETPDVLGYWRPDNLSEYVIGSDNIAIPKSASKPVLSHLMINDLLDNDIALRNFGWNGYQPPLTKLSARYLIDQDYIPENLMNAVVQRDELDAGLTFYEVEPSTEALWRQNWARFKAGG